MRRPTPQRVQEILRDLMAQTQSAADLAMLVAAIRRETGCSRATGYRSVAAAVEAGLVVFAEDMDQTETQ